MKFESLGSRCEKDIKKSHLGGQNTKKSFIKGQLSFCLSVSPLVQVVALRDCPLIHMVYKILLPKEYF